LELVLGRPKRLEPKSLRSVEHLFDFVLPEIAFRRPPPPPPPRLAIPPIPPLLPHPMALAFASHARRLLLAGGGAPARAFHAQPYQGTRPLLLRLLDLVALLFW